MRGVPCTASLFEDSVYPLFKSKNKKVLAAGLWLTSQARARAAAAHPLSPKPLIAALKPLLEAGVRVFRLKQDGTDYFDYHHTADDTLDKIDPVELQQNIAAWAVVTYLAAELEAISLHD